MTEELFSPPTNGLNRPFWSAARQGRLDLPYCVRSGRYFWPPSPISPFTDDGEVEWREAAAGGRLKSRITYRRSFQTIFAPVMPYGIGLVELDAGPRLLAYLPNPDAADSLLPGDHVSIVFAPIIHGGPLVPTLRK